MVEQFKFNPDEIGYWSEVKLEIVKQYAGVFSRILSSEKQAKHNLQHVYIDAFSGAGIHISKHTRELIPGSPMNAINISPPFKEYFFIDLNSDKADHLRDAVGPREDVHIFKGDCNQVLLTEVFPRVQYKDFRRGLCLLDPYGLHLNWDVMESAGKSKSIEIFLNFPIMDMNRNALWRNPSGVDPADIERMNKFWGDSSWQQVVYKDHPQLNLFGEIQVQKVGNEEVAEAFRKRLIEVAGFNYAPKPLAMRNENNAIVYYLFFASNNSTGEKIAKHIFKKYEARGA